MYFLFVILLILQECNGEVSNRRNVYELEKMQLSVGNSQTLSKRFSKFKDQDESIKMEEQHEVDSQDGLKVLPLEFVALEACLEATCSRLDSEVNVTSLQFCIFFFFFYYYGPAVIYVN
jgi:hypothetical protein